MSAIKFKFGITLIIGAAIAFITLASVLSYMLDPFGLYKGSRYIPAGQNSAMGVVRDLMSSYSILAKAKQIIDERPDTIILGSSIEDGAYRVRGSTRLYTNPDPEKTKKFEALQPDGISVYNAAIRGGGMQEALEFLQHAYANNPHLHKVVLGIEWGVFTSVLKERTAPPTPPILNQTYFSPAYFLEYAISDLALKSDYSLLNTLRLKKSYRFLMYALTPESSLIVPMANFVRGYFSAGEQPKDSTKLLLHSDESGYYVNLFFSASFLNEIKFLFKKQHEDERAVIDPDALKQLSDIVTFCRTHSIDLKVYISPQPQIFWGMARKFGLEKYWHDWLRAVTRITPVYDFSSSIDNAEPSRFFLGDSRHFNEDAGLIMFEALFSTHSSVHPDYLTQQSIEDAITKRDAATSQWLNHHLWVSGIIDAMSTEDPEVMNNISNLPTHSNFIQYASDYKKFHIFHVMGIFLGVPETVQPPYDLAMLLNQRQGLVLQAKDLKSLFSRIDEKAP